MYEERTSPGSAPGGVWRPLKMHHALREGAWAHTITEIHCNPILDIDFWALPPRKRRTRAVSEGNVAAVRTKREVVLPLANTDRPSHFRRTLPRCIVGVGAA